MSREEIITRLRENIDKVVLVTWTGSCGVQRMTIHSVDDEGFVNQVEGELFWATFDDVDKVEPLDRQILH